MPGEFDGLHAIVTGGTGFLGAAVVARLVRAGARVSVPALLDREADRFEFRDHPRVRLWRNVELADEPAVERFFSEAVEWGGGALWASIHVAGGFAMGPVAETSARDFDHLMRTNALSCFLCCRQAVRAMRPAPGGTPPSSTAPSSAAHGGGAAARGSGGGAGGVGGRIVNVAARPALEPRAGAGMVAYTASKAAVAAITLALAEEVVHDGILVNAVVPSIMDTPANRAAMPQADASRWPSVDDVAATILFLASPANTATRAGLVPVYGRA
jgi:NAD(P)-dependent dehydrogenase (short-subunit alcohol dehydrogenase family)